MCTKPKYFVPISLGNRFYSRRRVSKLYSQYLCKSDVSLIVICDSLRNYSKLASSSIISNFEAESYTQVESKSLINMLRKIGISNDPKIKVTLLSSILEETDFSVIQGKFIDFLDTMPTVVQRLHQLVMQWGKHHYGEVNDRIYNLQERYIIEETMLSIYATEILGYPNELVMQQLRCSCPYLENNLSENPMDIVFYDLCSILKDEINLENIAGNDVSIFSFLLFP